jgi:rhamnogalacturonyl hydrolase YesR
LGGSLLARTWSHTRNDEYLEVARKALQYTAQHQQPNGAWWYGEKENMHWVDNFHTGYVLDCFKYYLKATGDSRFDPQMQLGYEYWKSTFFLEDGTPRYYDHKLLPIDIQCCSQAIDTLVFFNDKDPDNLELEIKIAKWTIKHMQDPDGHFYYRRYSSWLTNRTPTLHWGQATMMCALSGLYQKVRKNSRFV